MPVTHAERAARRQAVVRCFEAGMSLAEVQSRFPYSPKYLDQLRIRARLPPAGGLRSRNFEIIAALLNTSLTFQQIGTRHGLTRQRVQQIDRACREAGIPVRARRRNRAG